MQAIQTPQIPADTYAMWSSPSLIKPYYQQLALEWYNSQSSAALFLRVI